MKSYLKLIASRLLKIVKDHPIKSALDGIGLILIIVYVHSKLDAWVSPRPGDFYQFWVGGLAARDFPVTSIYPPHERTKIRQDFYSQAEESESSRWKRCARYWRRLELAGTPFLYATILTFSSGDFETDYARFRRASFLIYMVGILLLGRLLRFSYLFIYLFIYFLTRHFISFTWDYYYANVNQLQFGWVAITLWIQSRSWKGQYFLAGFMYGLIIFFKPTLAILLLVLFMGWAINKEKQAIWQTSVGFAGAALFCYFYPSLLFGEKCTWGDWWGSFQHIVFSRNYMKHSFLYQLYRIRDLDVYRWLVVGLTVFSGFVFWWNRSYHVRSQQPLYRSLVLERSRLFLDVQLVTVGFLIFLLSSPLVHQHYYVPMIFPALYCFRPWNKALPVNIFWQITRILAGGAAFFIISFHLYLYQIRIAHHKSNSIWNYYGVIIFLITILVDVWLVRRALRRTSIA